MYHIKIIWHFILIMMMWCWWVCRIDIRASIHVLIHLYVVWLMKFCVRNNVESTIWSRWKFFFRSWWTNVETFWWSSIKCIAIAGRCCWCVYWFMVEIGETILWRKTNISWEIIINFFHFFMKNHNEKKIEKKNRQKSTHFS